jgi:predicted transcriptional regulator
MGSGLINEIRFDGHNAYVITEKGMMYLEEYKKFSDLASSFGLEL